MIVGTRKASSSIKEIEDESGYSQGAIRRTLDSIYICDEGHSLLRNSTPLKYTSWAYRRMLQCLRSHLKMTYDKCRKATGLKMSDTYIIDLTIAAELKHWRMKKRPELILEIVAERLF